MLYLTEPSLGPDVQDRRPPPRLVSIVVPAFNESGNINVLAAAVHEVMGTQAYELIFVDDGSRDDTFARVRALGRENPSVVGISLSRNFGHQNALLAGITHARGDVVITMDGDMQHPPGLIPTLIEKWRGGANVVHTRRQDTQHLTWFKRTTSKWFYRLFSVMCGVSIEPGMADFRLIDRRVAKELLAVKEGRLFLRALIVWMGYNSATVSFTVGDRYSGTSKYTLRKMFKLAMNGMMSFSTIPLRFSLWLGAFTAFLSFLELAFVLMAWLLGKTIPGWASTMGVIAFLFGVLFLILGIQGQYLLRLYERARQRPQFLIDRISRSEGREPGDDEA